MGREDDPRREAVRQQREATGVDDGGQLAGECLGEAVPDPVGLGAVLGIDPWPQRPGLHSSVARDDLGSRGQDRGRDTR